MRGFSANERRLSDRVARFLRELIITGELQPGERIRETEIAERLQVSRAPVREAVLQLERESLVEKQPHRGATVRHIDEDMLREVAQVRLQLETAVAVEMARAGQGHPGLQMLRHGLEEMNRAAAHGDRAALSAAHVAFHRSFVAVTTNSVMREVLNSLWARMPTFLHVIHGRYVRDDVQSIVVDGHEALLKAIEFGDEIAVVRSMWKHLETTGPQHD